MSLLRTLSGPAWGMGNRFGITSATPTAIEICVWTDTAGEGDSRRHQTTDGGAVTDAR